MKWKGPFKIAELLDNCLEDAFPKPPEENSVYVISKLKWDKEPCEDCIPLYVGSNTGRSKRFRTRVGDLIADMFGFFGTETGHHSGGITLHRWCGEQKLNPKELYIGWLEDYSECIRCAENTLYSQLKPILNRNRPNRCTKHNR
jgi:hypothetical protein